jgi:putative pyruvate formate lyase activating enzyme
MMFSIQDKIKKLEIFLEKHKDNKTICTMCPHLCRVDRNRVLGRCREPYLPRVASFNLHHGEEPPISGEKGSGTIFFSGCNMNCVYCQNFPISQLHQANRELTIEGLADIMLELASRNAHNINFVTPSHYLYQTAEALKLAYEKGLSIPIVYNTSGFDSVEMIRDLEGVLDIYLPDAKYYDPEISMKYSNVRNYFEEDSRVLKEMFRQTGGKLELDENGIALSGMVIRHLVLPGNVKNSRKVLSWISENLSSEIPVSIMAQYFPAHRVSDSSCGEINRRLSREEYDEILDYAEELGFENAWIQEYRED